MFPWRGEEKEGCITREKEELKEGMQVAIALGTPPGLVGSRAHQSASPVPLCSALKQAVGIIVDFPALRDGPPLDSHRGQCKEKWRKQKRKERGKGLLTLRHSGSSITSTPSPGVASSAEGTTYALRVLKGFVEGPRTHPGSPEDEGKCRLRSYGRSPSPCLTPLPWICP